MATWKEIYNAVPNKPFGVGKDEQALTEAFENFVGGPKRGFHLMRIYGKSLGRVSKNYFKRDKADHIDLEQDFRDNAMYEGFTNEEATAYLDYVAEV